MLQFNKLAYLLPVIIVINSFPPKISSQNPFEINFTIKGAKKAINYIKVEICKDEATCFGETFNGKDWYEGGNPLSYFPININSSTTSGIVKGRIDSDYQGPGDYKLKIQRFTASGNQANDIEDPVTTYINYETPAPSPIPSQTPLTSPTTTPISLAVSTKPSDKPVHTSSLSPQVLSIMATPRPILVNNNFSVIPALVFAIGLFLIGLPMLMFVRTKLNRYNEKNVPAQKNN